MGAETGNNAGRCENTNLSGRAPEDQCGGGGGGKDRENGAVQLKKYNTRMRHGERIRITANGKSIELEFRVGWDAHHVKGLVLDEFAPLSPQTTAYTPKRKVNIDFNQRPDSLLDVVINAENSEDPSILYCEVDKMR